MVKLTATAQVLRDELSRINTLINEKAAEIEARNNPGTTELPDNQAPKTVEEMLEFNSFIEQTILDEVAAMTPEAVERCRQSALEDPTIDKSWLSTTEPRHCAYSVIKPIDSDDHDSYSEMRNAAMESGCLYHHCDWERYLIVESAFVLSTEIEAYCCQVTEGLSLHEASNRWHFDKDVEYSRNLLNAAYNGTDSEF